jgi:ERCC4-type nuclease
MLGRLLEEGLITEIENGKYKITHKGLGIAEDIQSVHKTLQKQLDVMFRLGNIGKFMAKDLIDRVSSVGSTLSANLDKMTEQEREKYKEFLKTELKKIEDQEQETK